MATIQQIRLALQHAEAAGATADAQVLRNALSEATGGMSNIAPAEGGQTTQRYIVTAPDGTKYQVTTPAGATQDQVMAYAQSQYAQQAKPWPQVEASPAYQALSPDQQDAARAQYFAQVVAPHVPTVDLTKAWGQFTGAQGSIAQINATMPPALQGLVMQRIHADAQSASSPQARERHFQQIQAQNVASMSPASRFVAGMGEGAKNFWQGAKENTYDRISDVLDGGNRVAQDEARIGEQRNLSQILNATTAGKLGNLTGSIAESAPLALIPGAGEAGLATRLALSGGSGLLAGYLAPAASSTEHNLNTLVGGATGLAAPAFAGLGRRAITGFATPAARKLIDAGVRLTPGQTVGGALQRVEDGLTSVPLVGDMIRNAQRRSVETFNKAALDKALAPLGIKVPAHVAAGHDAINFGVDATRAAYDDALKGTTTVADQQLMGGLAARINALPQRVRQKVLDVLESRVFPAINESGGRLDGQQFKDMTSGVLGDKRAMGRATDPVERSAANALGNVLDDLKAAFARSNGSQAAAKLSAADRAYRGFLELQDAAAHGSQGSNGVFTPGQFLAAVKRGDASKGKAAFARGTAHMQDLADTAASVLPRTVPDSGTPYRMFVGAGSLGGLGSLADIAGFGSVAHATVPAALLMGASTLPYTRLGGGIARVLLAPKVGPVRSALGGFVGTYGSRAALPILIGAERANRNRRSISDYLSGATQ